MLSSDVCVWVCVCLKELISIICADLVSHDCILLPGSEQRCFLLSPCSCWAVSLFVYSVCPRVCLSLLQPSLQSSRQTRTLALHLLMPVPEHSVPASLKMVYLLPLHVPVWCIKQMDPNSIVLLSSWMPFVWTSVTPECMFNWVRRIFFFSP